MRTFLTDLRLALRTLVRTPTFSLAFIVTLALGIGGVTAFFSVVHGVLLQPLPFPESSSLVDFHWRSGEGVTYATSAAKYRFWEEHSESFDAVAAFALKGAGVTLVGGNETEYVRSLGVSGDFFRTLGVTPVIGRGFTAEEDRPGGPCAAVLRHELWQEVFGGDPGVTRRKVQLGERSCAVVGVMPEDFRFQPTADLWTPLQLGAETRGGANLYGMMARLDDGVSREGAQSEAETLFARFLAATPEEDRTGAETGVVLGPLKERLVGDLRQDLLLLFGAGALVFLICCINLSNLVVTRASQRAQETATRVALGAGWSSLLRETVVEISLISLVAAAVGWLLARTLVPVMLALHPDSLPAIAEVQVGAAEVLFALAATFVAILLVAVVPVLRVARGGLASTLRSAGSKSSEVGVSGRRLGRWLVVGQVALSLAVLMGSFALIGSLLELRGVDPGFETEDVWTFQVPLQDSRFASPAATWSFATNLQTRLRKLPGVQSTATASSLPLEPGLNVPLHVEGFSQDGNTALEYRAVSPGYFETLGIPVLRGRGFDSQDGTDGAPVVIVNETLAERFWGTRDALGETVEIAKGLGALEDAPRRVIGVVADVRDVDLGSDPEPILYVPQPQVPQALLAVILQSFPLSAMVELDRGKLAVADLRRIVREVDSRQAVATVRPLSDLIRQSLVREQFYTLLLGLFGGLALVLTALGIYGVTSSQVSQRTQEIGLRMAVGARISGVLRMVVGEALKLAAFGILLGIPLAFGLRRLIEGLIPETVRGGGAPIFAVVALVMALVAVLASFFPARRAARVDPIVILR